MNAQRRFYEAAREVEQRRELAESQGESSGVEGNPFAEMAAIKAQMGSQDHNGRVRGLGKGAIPSQVLGRSRRSSSSCDVGGPSQSYESRLRDRAMEQTQRAMEEAQRAKEEAQRASEEAQRAKEEAQREREEAQREREESRRQQQAFMEEMARKMDEFNRRFQGGGGGGDF